MVEPLGPITTVVVTVAGLDEDFPGVGWLGTEDRWPDFEREGRGPEAEDLTGVPPGPTTTVEVTIAGLEEGFPGVGWLPGVDGFPWGVEGLAGEDFTGVPPGPTTTVDVTTVGTELALGVPDDLTGPWLDGFGVPTEDFKGVAADLTGVPPGPTTTVDVRTAGIELALGVPGMPEDLTGP